MTGGGGRWDEDIRWDREFLARQIAKQAEECGEWAAARFVRAMQFGGCSTPEAYGIMRDRFCAHLGSGHELWDTADVPQDRTYRDAWRRSHNGGPILLDERKVMEIDEARIARMWAAYESHLRQRNSIGPSYSGRIPSTVSATMRADRTS
jgi:hypothetical protein